MVFPYLVFDGNCEEALALYGQAFGGRNLHLRKYEEFAPDPSMKELVMHAEMDLGDVGHLSAADSPTPIEGGNALSIMVRAKEQILRDSWAVLAEEGEVVAELAPFEIENNSLMGTLIDKYGFTWIFTQDGE